MALGIATSKIDEVIVVGLSGVIPFGEESTSLRMHVKELLKNTRQIVMDLRTVASIDSGGLGTLVSLFASARKVGGEIKLAEVSRHPKEVPQITELDTVFEIFERAEGAGASFKRAATVP